MNTAWTRIIAVGLLLCPMGCEVHVSDGPGDGYSGDFGDGGTGGRAGNGGRSGSDGTAAYGGSGGSEFDGYGGTTDGSEFLAPTCDDELGDEQDPCVQCLKRSCCEEWLGCDDDACFQEWTGVSACVEMIQFPDDIQYGMCVSENSAADDGLPQYNTEALLSCANEANPLADADGASGQTRCGVECFGSDVFFE